MTTESGTHGHGNRTLTLPWQRPPVTTSGREGRQEKTQKATAVREVVRLLARADGVDQAYGEVEIELRWLVTDGWRRVADRMVATLTPAVAGLRDAGVLPADPDGVLVKAFCTITRGETAGLLLFVRPARVPSMRLCTCGRVADPDSVQCWRCG